MAPSEARPTAIELRSTVYLPFLTHGPPVAANKLGVPASNRTILQLSLRSLFLVTLVVAVLCALVAPWVRGLESGEKARLSRYVAGLMLVATLFLAVLCYRRWQVERQSGQLLLRTGIRHRVWYHVGFAIASIPLFALVFVWGIWMPGVLGSQSRMPPLLILAQPIAYVYAAVSYVVVVLWWRLDPMALEARENGLILGAMRFLPWSDIKSHRWGGPSPSHLTLQLHQVVINVPLDQRDKQDFEEILTAREGKPPSDERRVDS